MSKSLQEQLLAAGLVNKQKAAKAKKDQHKKRKSRGKKVPVMTESQRRAKLAAALEADKARELNRQKQDKAQKKAVRSQVQQLVDQHRLKRDGAEVSYKFSDQGKIRQVMVTDEQQKKLVAGTLAIVTVDERYELVPHQVAERIAERSEGIVVLMNERKDETADPDDPYADFQVPDDLMW